LFKATRLPEVTVQVAIEERMSRIFRDVFEDNSITIRDDMTADDIAAWDSLSHIDLLYAIEKEFNIVFTIGEAGSALKNVGELRALIEKKTAAKR
jgi:acyl carrier protein